MLVSHSLEFSVRSNSVNKLKFIKSYQSGICFDKMIKQEKILDYTFQRKLGEGSFGEVMLATKEGKEVAVKKISKEKIIKVNKLHEPFIEKSILFKLNQIPNSNYFIRLQATHSDEEYVYLILQFCQGGTLDDFIKSCKTLSQLIVKENLPLDLVRSIIVRLILMMETLHKENVIHRDLKVYWQPLQIQPSNILLSKDGFLKLSDFGTGYAPDEFYDADTAKQIKAIKAMAQEKKERKLSEEDLEESMGSTASSERRYTFVGTACYMAPELLNQDKCGPESDLWALGCIFYELINKKSPFFDESEGMVWTKILNNEVKVFETNENQKENKVDEENLQDLIQKLLVKEHDQRLGYGTAGYSNLKSHEFFKGVDWQSEKTKPIQQIKKFTEERIESEKLQLKRRASQKDKVLFTGVVTKKMYFGNYKQRTLVLHSTPKLVYYDTDSGEKKGEITLEKNTPVKLDGKYFEITNEKKTYYYKSKQAQEWVEMIKMAIMSAHY